jgi:hypothetical protein
VRKLALLLTAPLIVAAGLMGTSMVALADSQTSCVSPPNCKTVTVDGDGKLTSGSTSGNINFTGLAASTTYTAPDSMEALATSHQYVGGSYTLSFAATCAVGSATSSSYTVTGVTQVSNYPTPPATSGTLPTITSDASGNFNCNYTLTYPTIDSSNDTTCGNGHLCSVRNDIWVMSGTTKVTQTASFSVEPDGQPPTSIPEAPLPILIPVGIVLIIGAGLVVWRRKLFATS